MNKIPEKLIDLCQSIGARIPVWTQGAGGNISMKEAEVLWIKASGVRLDEVSEEKGIAGLKLSQFCSFLKDQGSSLTEESYSGALGQFKHPHYGRPSMEAGFHAVLPKTWVMHFHSLSAVLMGEAITKRPEKWANWLALRQKGLQICVLPDLMPGKDLMLAIQKNLNDDVYLLKNHGVILQADDLALLKEWQNFEFEFCRDWGYLQLLELLKSNQPWKDSIEKVKKKESFPLKIYFPDTAVFYEKLLAQLDSPSLATPHLYRLKDQAWETQLNLAEIWCATGILQIEEPALDELNDEISSQVGGLPTEKLRKAVQS